MRRSELVTVPSFSPQAAAGSRICAPALTVSLREDVFRHHEADRACAAPRARRGARQRHRRIGRHHPQRLDLAALDRLEHLHGLEAFALRHVRRAPEAADAIDVGRREIHMRGELIGEPADLAAAHGIGLAGERERPHARLADAAGGEMAIDDGGDLVGALRRLVHALRKAGDDVRRRAEQVEETRDVGLGKPGGLRRCGQVRRDLARARERVRQAGRMRIDIFVIERQRIGEMHQQAAEQRGVHAGRDGQEQVGIFRGRGAARVDHDDLGAARALVGDHALVQHRMAPGGVGADQNDEIGVVEILIGARHGVGAEGAAMAGDRRRHAQPRIGVDIGRADEALHQLVGDVIILGQQLAGQIETRPSRGRVWRSCRQSRSPPHRARCPTRFAPAFRRPAAASDAAAGCRGRASRPARSPSSTAARNSPDDRDRRRSPRRRARRAWPARRSRRRNKGQVVRTAGGWCAGAFINRRPAGNGPFS